MTFTKFFFVLLAVVSSSQAALLSNFSGAGPSSAGIRIYTEDPLDLVVPINLVQQADDDVSQLDLALVGTALAAGGNVELFSNSESGAFDDESSATSAFAVAQRATLQEGGVTVTSLNGEDWFSLDGGGYSTGQGASNFANKWFGEYYTYLSSTIDPTFAAFLPSEVDLYDDFLAANGFQQISDPNISYINVSGTIAEIGLAGFLDSTVRLAPLFIDPLNPAFADLPTTITTLSAAFPGGIQVSEVALINGEAQYAFGSPVASGVVLNDGFGSYSATYEVLVTIPEPSSFLLVAFGLGFLSVRRRHTS